MSYEYDTRGRTITENYIDSLNSTVGRIVSYVYTSEMAGSVIKSNTVTKKVNLTDNGGVLEINKYDLAGNVIEHTECKGGTPYTTKYEYNNFGKPSLAKEPYKSAGVLKETQKKMQYNALGALVYVQEMMDTPTDTTDDICSLYSVNTVSLKVESQCRQKYDESEVIITCQLR